MASLQSKSSPLLNNSLPGWKKVTMVLGLLIFALLASSARDTSAADQIESSSAFCLDRFERAWAVLIGSNEKLIVPTSQLPELAREGDILLVKFDPAGNVIDAQIDWEATRLKKECMQALLRQLLEQEEHQEPAADNKTQQ